MPHSADERLRSQLEQKLVSHGIRPPCRVTVAVRNGMATLTGTVQFDYQKRAAAHACRATSGVKGVVDQIHVAAHQSPWAAKASEWAVGGRTGAGHHAAAWMGRTPTKADSAPGPNPSANHQTAS